MLFESYIETTNRHYEIAGLAAIHKIPTPAKNINGRIVYSGKSTVDFIGLVKKHGTPVPIAFEAKETTGRKDKNGSRKPETSFPLFSHKKPMISDHQFQFLQRWERMGGMAFVLVNFPVRGECYRVPVDFLGHYYHDAQRGGPKSIPIDHFKTKWKADPRDYLELLG